MVLLALVQRYEIYIMCYYMVGQMVCIWAGGSKSPMVTSLVN